MTRASATSIPYEVLLNIFTHLIDPEAIETGDQPSLKHATLVCRTWVNPAQSILWQSGATLQGDRDVEKFVSTASRRRVGPKEISLHGLRDAKSLPKLWDSIKGVESLYIVAQGVPISAATFDHPALADLKSLTLSASLTPSDSSLVLPFKLSRLNLSDMGLQTRHQTSFLAAISRSSMNTMRSLAILSVASAAHVAVASAMLPFANNLRHCGLAVDRDHDLSPYIKVIEACQSLRSFECSSLPLHILHALPETLRGLATMEERDWIPYEQLKVALTTRLKRVERLYFSVERKWFELTEMGQAVIDEMDRRNGKIHFIDDY